MFKTAKLDLTYLLKENYDKNMDKLLGQDTPVANLADVKQGTVSHHAAVWLIYCTKDAFKNIAKNLGIMDDFKSGVPR